MTIARVLFAAFLIGLLGSLAYFGENMSFRASAGTSGNYSRMNSDPTTLGLTLTYSAIWLGFPRHSQLSLRARHVPNWERWLAAFIDFSGFVIATVSISIAVTLVAEWISTDSFKWSWSRGHTSISDFTGIASLLVALGYIWFYLTRPMSSKRPSPGQFLLGFRLVEEPENSQGSFARIAGYLGLSTSMIAIMRKFTGRWGETPADHWSLTMNIRAVSTR